VLPARHVSIEIKHEHPTPRMFLSFYGMTPLHVVMQVRNAYNIHHFLDAHTEFGDKQKNAGKKQRMYNHHVVREHAASPQEHTASPQKHAASPQKHAASPQEHTASLQLTVKLRDSYACDARVSSMNASIDAMHAASCTMP
jgi:hypothetical protein